MTKKIIKRNVSENAMKTDKTVKLPLETIAIKSNYFKDESELILIKSQSSSKTLSRLLIITKRNKMQWEYFLKYYFALYISYYSCFRNFSFEDYFLQKNFPIIHFIIHLIICSHTLDLYISINKISFFFFFLNLLSSFLFILLHTKYETKLFIVAFIRKCPF